MNRIIGIDWGEERIGLALGDTETGVASPLTTVKSIDEIIKYVKEEDVELLVVGKPTKLSGKNDHMTEYTEFCESLEKSGICRIVYYDERLSSKAADALNGDKKTKANRDELAAMLILQDYLNSK